MEKLFDYEQRLLDRIQQGVDRATKACEEQEGVTIDGGSIYDEKDLADAFPAFIKLAVEKIEQDLSPVEQETCHNAGVPLLLNDSKLAIMVCASLRAEVEFEDIGYFRVNWYRRTKTVTRSPE